MFFPGVISAKMKLLNKIKTINVVNNILHHLFFPLLKKISDIQFNVIIQFNYNLLLPLEYI